MDCSSFDINRFKMQLKARLRVPMLMESKRMNFEFSKFFNTPQLSEMNMNSYTQSRIKMNKSYINSFDKFSLKTNLIRRVLLKMAIKDIYEEEKDCSKQCNEAINNIDLQSGSLELLNLPLIKQDNITQKKKINLKSIKIHRKPIIIKPLILKNLKSEIHNSPLLSSTNKYNSYLESTRDKSRQPLTTKRSSKIEFTPRDGFKFKENFTIIKGGGIKYNNSMYRLKNMNDLLHFKI